MEKRLEKTRAILATETVNSLLISSSYNIRYLTEFDAFQTDDHEGYVLLTQSNIYLLASSLTAEGAREKLKGSSVKVIELSAQKRLLTTLQEIIDKEKINALGFEENLTYSEYKRFKKLKVKLKITEEIVEQVRQVKDKTELDSIKKACKLTDDVFSFVLKQIRIGISEEELAWIIERYIREYGGELAFPSIVAFGENSAIPHHKSTNRKLTTDNIVLLDFGAKVDGYCADMTRTIFFGKADDKFKKMYETNLQASNLSLIASGQDLTPHIIDQAARSYINDHRYPNIPHTVGHGVGLEVHELPHISSGVNEVIEPNTAFTIEPGIYIPGFGGVRIEDTVYYDGKKIISLTNSPKKLIELSS